MGDYSTKTISGNADTDLKELRDKGERLKVNDEH